MSDKDIDKIEQYRDKLEKLLKSYNDLNNKNLVILKECKSSIRYLKTIMILTVIVAIFCILMVITFGYKVYAKDKFKQKNYKENIEINVTDNVE